MLLRSLRLCGLLALLMMAGGCGSGSQLPPGGAAAVRYWHAVLQQHPDLPEKVRAIVESRGEANWDYELPAEAQVYIYGQDQVVSVSGRHIDVIVTDLDRDTLRRLLAWWETVPRLAKQLDLDTTLPFSLPESTRHIVVLGSEGRIAISGPGGQDIQSIDIRVDEASARTSIGVHSFAPEGQLAMEQLGRAYNQVRGPPHSAVAAGEISLPPPEENVTVLVVGQLAALDIAGAADDAQQDISFVRYLNHHDAVDQVTGVYAGQPFVGNAAYVAERTIPADDLPDQWYGESDESDSDNSISENATASNGTQTISPPQNPPTIPGNYKLLETPLNQLPNNNFNQYRPPQGFHGIPGGGYRPPTFVVPRFGS